MKLVISVILLLLSSTFSRADQSGKVFVGDFSVREIFIITDVEEILGLVQPNSVEYIGIQEQSGLDSWNIDDNGLFIYLDSEHILRLECTSSCETNVGIEIGDGPEKVMQVLGNPNRYDSEYITYQFCGENYCADAFLYFYFSNNKLEKIMYWVAYV